jgi:uncharacterized membrane protein YgcG
MKCILHIGLSRYSAFVMLLILLHAMLGSSGTLNDSPQTTSFLNSSIVSLLRVDSHLRVRELTAATNGKAWSTWNMPPSPMIDPVRCGRPDVATSAVCDPDNSMTKDEKDAIEGRINLQFKDGLAEVAVLVVKKISMWSNSESFARTVHDTWGVGDKKTNNGILLFLSIDDRDIYISIGSGIPLRNADLDSVIDSMKPLCRDFRYASAVELGLEQLNALLQNPDIRYVDYDLYWIAGIIIIFLLWVIIGGMVESRNARQSSELKEGNKRIANLMKEIKENETEESGIYMSSSCPICLDDFPTKTIIDCEAPSHKGLETIGLNPHYQMNSAAAGSNPKRPMSLQCGHVCCHSCLVELFDAASRARTKALCPMCRAPCETTIPSANANASVNNTNVGNVVPPQVQSNVDDVDAQVPLMSRAHGCSFNYNRRMEFLYRARRINECYPSSLDTYTLNSIVSAIDSGNLPQASRLLQTRSSVNYSTISSIAPTRYQATSSGSFGSSKSSFGGGWSSGGRSGKW